MLDLPTANRLQHSEVLSLQQAQEDQETSGQGQTETGDGRDAGVVPSGDARVPDRESFFRSTSANPGDGSIYKGSIYKGSIYKGSIYRWIPY